MKKILVIAAVVALAFVSCDKSGQDVDGSGSGDGSQNSISGLVYNELDGQNKFIEFYNNSDKAISLEGVYVVKYDAAKEGGKSVTWTGKAGQTIASKGYFVIESSDLCDDNEDGIRDNDYVYESEDHVFKGGLSPKKNTKFELYDATDKLLDTFIRGSEGSSGWNQGSKISENEDCSYSRVPDGTGEFVYAAPTKKAANGDKVADIPQI